MSPRKPYITVEMAEPPTHDDCTNPSIVPLFSSGRASIIEAEKTVFPAVFKSAPKNANTHRRMKFEDIYPSDINTTESVKHTESTR